MKIYYPAGDRTLSLESKNYCFPMPTHCTIKRFGSRARRINGFECGLFLNYTPLGQTTSREVEVRVTVSVTVCVVWNDDERKGEDETQCRLIACSSRKAPRGPPDGFGI